MPNRVLFSTDHSAGVHHGGLHTWAQPKGKGKGKKKRREGKANGSHGNAVENTWATCSAP